MGWVSSSALEQAGNLGSVDAVVLGLGAVDELHVQRVAQREGDGLVLTQIGEPVPGEHALAADDDALAKGSDGLEEDIRIGGEIFGEDGVAVGVKDVREHASGVQINAAVECVGRVVHMHGILLSPVW